MFTDGYIQGDVAKSVDNVDGEDNCAIHVKYEYPGASGATWYLNQSCWAEFGEYFVRSSAHRTCLYKGRKYTFVIF